MRIDAVSGDVHGERGGTRLLHVDSGAVAPAAVVRDGAVLEDDRGRVDAIDSPTVRVRFVPGDRAVDERGRRVLDDGHAAPGPRAGSRDPGEVRDAGALEAAIALQSRDELHDRPRLHLRDGPLIILPPGTAAHIRGHVAPFCFTQLML